MRAFCELNESRMRGMLMVVTHWDVRCLKRSVHTNPIKVLGLSTRYFRLGGLFSFKRALRWALLRFSVRRESRDPAAMEAKVGSRCTRRSAQARSSQDWTLRARGRGRAWSRGHGAYLVRVSVASTASHDDSLSAVAHDDHAHSVQQSVPLHRLRSCMSSLTSPPTCLLTGHWSGDRSPHQFLLGSLALLHPPSRTYVDTWTGDFLGEGGMLPVLSPAQGAKGEVIMPKLGNATAK